jgi:hypothetical protein
MAEPNETVATIDRGARGTLNIAICRTGSDVAFVELQHVDDAGNKGRGSTLQISELPAIITALRSISVKEQQRQRLPTQQSLLSSGPDEAARRDMAVF